MGKNSLLELIIKGLAVYRISRMVTKEDGPGDVFALWKAYLDSKDGYIFKVLHDLFDCPYCLAVWVALVIGYIPSWLVYVFALAGIQALLQDVSDYLNSNEGNS